MSSESVHNKRKGRRYNIVVIPSDDAGRTATFRVRPLVLVIIACILFIIVGGITFTLLNYTPLALFLPVTNPALEEKYGRKIVALQEKLDQVTSSVLILEDYNSKLRKVLGDESTTDSGAIRKGSATENQRGGVPVEDERLPIMPAQQSGTIPVSTAVQGRLPFEIRQSEPNPPMSSPTQGFITHRYDPANRHFGIDIAGKVGTAIYAAADGHVLFAGWTVDDGNMIIIAHNNGVVTFYKHNQALLVGSNTTVKRGEPIALLGNSGKTSFGPHLHFEVWFNGTPRDPGEFIVNAHL
jgi:murein DD-endopeptidase MepM/ murein hydrolase activator NlpD